MASVVQNKIPFETALQAALEGNGIDFSLKPQQEEVLRTMYLGCDVLAVLPTGFGKSLIFQLLPRLLSANSDRPGIILVVSPLNAIITDQMLHVRQQGLRAGCLSVSGLLLEGVDMAEEEEESELEIGIELEETENLIELKNGAFDLVFAHPEALLSSKTGRDLMRSHIYKENVKAVVIDEAHCVTDW